MIIDCHANPYDMSVPAAHILNDIVAARQQNHKRPIAVLLGERHSVLPSVLLPIAVTSAIMQQGLKPCFAIEFNHNIGDELARVGYQYESVHRSVIVTDPPSLSIVALDRALSRNLQEKAVMRGMLGFDQIQHVTQNKAEFLLKQNITPCFSDAARAVHDTLDEKDFLTSEFMNCATIDKKSAYGVFAADRNGMKIRNVMMTELALHHHKLYGGDTIIHAVGASHVMGKAKEASYADSMAALYAAKGYCVLSYMMERNDMEALPSDAPQNEVSFIKGWQDMPKMGARCPAERIEISRLAAASKGLISFRDIDAVEAQQHADHFKSHLQARNYRKITLK